MKLVNTVINTNVFLALAAVLLTVSAQIQLGLKPQLQPYLLLIFIATFFEYNRNRITTTIFNDVVVGSKNNEPACLYTKKLKFVIFLLVVAFIFTAIEIELTVLGIFAILGILTFLYSSPFLEINGLKLREIPYLKIFLITFVWSCATILVPAVQAGEKIFSTQVLFLFIERYLFIFSIAIQFDIRDMQTDKEAGLKTIPTLINKDKSIIISYLSLLICFLISFFHYQIQNKGAVTGAISISILTTYLFIKSHFPEKPSRYYYYILDGTLLLQGILVLGFYFLNFN